MRQRLWAPHACRWQFQRAGNCDNTAADVWERTESVARLAQGTLAFVGVAVVAGVGRGDCAAPAKCVKCRYQPGASRLDAGHVCSISARRVRGPQSDGASPGAGARRCSSRVYCQGRQHGALADRAEREDPRHSPGGFGGGRGAGFGLVCCVDVWGVL